MILTTVNAVADVASNADSPSAAANTCTNTPLPMPQHATKPARQPCVALRAMMNSESGPGVMLSSSPETMNSHRCWVPAMRPPGNERSRIIAPSPGAVNAAAVSSLLRPAV